MKVLIGHWGHEANTFAEKAISYEEYTGRGPTFGKDCIPANEGTPSFLGGIIRACREENIEMIPTCAYTAAAPILSRNCANQMLESILSVCRKHKDEIDGVCIALHGAGVSEDSDDLESYVLKKIRDILGNKIPITVPMDLHGNVSEEMTRLADGLFGIRQYPHTDKDSASYLAMKTLARVLRGEVKIKTEVVHMPLLIPISAGMTKNPPFPEIEAYFKQYIEKEKLIDATLFHGFPYADVSSGTASVVVVAEDGAKQAAEHLAKYVWKKRHHFKSVSHSAHEAMELAKKVEKPGFVVINESSDNPGGGCPGDGTHLIGEMLRQNLPGSIFGYLVDPEAVNEIFCFKPGQTLDLTLGGKHEAIFGKPLQLKDVTVVALSDGVFRHTSPSLHGLLTTMGKCARIRKGNVDIIIGSNRNQTFDDRPFAITGADLREYRYVGLKSTQHFLSYFQDKAAGIISCDSPGLNSSDLSVFPYIKIPRPIYPLDPDVDF